MTIRVLLADDQTLVRDGFRMILEAQDDLEVTGAARDGAEAVEMASVQRPDLVLMDIRMPRMDGIAATRQITAALPDTRVLVLTTFDLDDYVYDALLAGASGFLLKDVGRDELVNAVRVVAGGEALLAPSVTRRLLGDFVRSRSAATQQATQQATQEAPQQTTVDRGAGPEVLTGRELDTLNLLAQGLSNLQIAERMVVSEHTVKTHVSNVFHKLGLRDRVHAVIYAYEHGLISPGG
ncbi:MAG TPA: response regulator transcription factor [Kribbellaceae bacterium]|nr:response regulator transcription factor [Kribbellaceae bacterium]